MNFNIIDEELIIDWNRYVEQLPELDLSEFNLDHLEPSHFVSLEFTEPLVYTEPLALTKPLVYTQPLDFTEPLVYAEPLVFTEPLALTKPLVYTEPLVFTEQNPDEFLFDGLLDLSWFVPEEMILEQGQMYGGANRLYKVLNTSV